MRLFRWIRPFGLLVALLAALTDVGSAAPATQITGIQVETEPNGSPAVVLQFNGQPPQITPVGNGTTQITLLIPNVAPGPLVPPLTNGNGSIQSVAVTQSAGNTSVFIRLTPRGGFATARPVRSRSWTCPRRIPETSSSRTHPPSRTVRPR